MEENIYEAFKRCNETIVWSCLQGIMGELHTNSVKDSAVAVLGDFAFYAGNPSEEMFHFKSESCSQDFIIMIPQNDEWAELIEKCYGNKARKVTRYATKKEHEVFDIEKLKEAIVKIPDGYELKMIKEPQYHMCQNNAWANDLVSQYKDYNTYKELGLGVVALKSGELAAGASSYSTYDKGIEIEIDTKLEYRRRGLAYACGAKLILECLKRGLYPSWDAQNEWSLALAEKLGYHFDHEYAAYEVIRN
ncbi:MAG: GNAT family N-acetyltransferase [Eubacteriales bacterium]|nr:GNAT family N-acetyltransferase [Eubacteriales bacterium]